MTVYAIYEGERTEPDYFTNFQRCYRGEASFEISPIPKDSFDISQTDRNKMFKIADGYIKWITRKVRTPYYFATVVLRDFYIVAKDAIGIWDDHSDKAKKLIRRMDQARDKCVKLSASGKYVDSDGFVKDNTSFLEVVTSEIESIKNEYKLKGLDYRFTKVDSINGDSTFNPSTDRIFIVFDRDIDLKNQTTRSPEEYKDIIRRCDNQGYEVLLSTPKFEFWLLLHHDDVCLGDYGITDGELVDTDLKRKEGIDPNADYKKISEERFEKFYRRRFEQALAMSHSE